MNISEVKVKLLGSDILSIINEFVKIEGLTLKSKLIPSTLQYTVATLSLPHKRSIH